MNKNPLFSIVIASYNYGNYIEQAIQSIVEQDFDKYEILVIDGGSTDNTVDILKKYDENIEYWISEKDSGQSDAFNKGFNIAKGEYFFWLNADDILLPNSLRKISEYIKKFPDYQWFVGNTVFFDNQNKILRCRIGNDFNKFLIENAHIYVSGPSTIFHRDLYFKSGCFDLSCNYSMDTDLWMRFCNLGYKFKRIKSYIWGFRIHEESKTSHTFSEKPSDKFTKEQSYILSKNHWKYSQFKIKLQFLYKLLTGVFITSFYDSYRYKSHNVSTFKK